MAKNKVVLISGGSSGIGLETAKAFAHAGFDLIITSLDEDELESVLNQLRKTYTSLKIEGFTIDLSQKDSAQAFYNRATAISPAIDVVINNAGFGTFGFINDIDISREYEMLMLMVVNLHLSTRLFLKDMIECNKGSIINISSISAFQPNPGLATYGAAKAFVYHFSRALDVELKDIGSKVRCITVCPTPVKTNFQNNSGMQSTGLFDSWISVESQMVGSEIFRAYKKGKAFIVPGRIYQLIAAFTRVLPEFIQIRLSKAFLEEKHQ